jgi:hypothetical protein
VAYTGFENLRFGEKMVSGGQIMNRWLADFGSDEGRVGESGWLVIKCSGHRDMATSAYE